MAFFDVLPADLHLCIFHTWIGGDQEVISCLSELDIACCERSVRPAYLFLLASLIPIGAEGPVPVNCVKGFFIG